MKFSAKIKTNYSFVDSSTEVTTNCLMHPHPNFSLSMETVNGGTGFCHVLKSEINSPTVDKLLSVVNIVYGEVLPLDRFHVEAAFALLGVFDVLSHVTPMMKLTVNSVRGAAIPTSSPTPTPSFSRSGYDPTYDNRKEVLSIVNEETRHFTPAPRQDTKQTCLRLPYVSKGIVRVVSECEREMYKIDRKLRDSDRMSELENIKGMKEEVLSTIDMDSNCLDIVSKFECLLRYLSSLYATLDESRTSRTVSIVELEKYEMENASLRKAKAADKAKKVAKKEAKAKNKAKDKELKAARVKRRKKNSSPLKDMMGKEFGHLTVIGGPCRLEWCSELGWVCECICGSRVTVCGSSLRLRGKTHCGCHGVDLRGKIIRTWKITGRGPCMRKGKLTLSNTSGWTSECTECGTKRTLTSRQMANQNPSQCECQSPCSEVNMLGKTFGRWVVLERSPGSDIWKCHCECGEVKDVCGRNLRQGKSSSCIKCSRKRSERKKREVSSVTA